jgi:hypothetical protein
VADLIVVEMLQVQFHNCLLPRNAGKDEVVLYQKVSMGSGKQSGNPWLLELPDPITRASWGNYAMISLAKANELGLSLILITNIILINL